MFPTFLTYTMIAIIWLDYIFERILDRLNEKTWDKPIPSSLSDLYNEEEYKKAKAYNHAKRNMGRISAIISTAVVIAILMWGGFGVLQTWIDSITTQPIFQALIFFGIIGFGSSLMSLPFSLYSTFVIDEQYGFNKTTPKLFVSDMIKGLLISVVLGGGILSAVVAFYHWQPEYFWIYAWALISGFSIVMAAFYTSVFVPMFNKLTPIAEGSLQEKLQALSVKCNFPLHGVFVIDGSKRSTKANAYFSGIGPKKRIVLYDTLIEQLTEEEVVAVMAHEIGHYERKHILKSVVISVLQTGFTLFLLSLCLKMPQVQEALGYKQHAFHIGMIAFSLLYSPFATVIGLAQNVLSRKHEYEADAYAAEHADGEALISGLKKLHKDSLSNIQPHPAFVFVHYSHPTLLQRINSLRNA